MVKFKAKETTDKAMEIKGKVWCMFEQSGTFKNEFIKLGIDAVDLDIQNKFGETDHVIDLFAEIENGYDGKPSIFDNISKDDLIVAFFPCIYFCVTSQAAFGFANNNYKKLSDHEKIEKIIDREKKRDQFLTLLLKLIGICCKRKIRMVFENPITMSFLNTFFVKDPDIRDMDRTTRGDYVKKPTGYWFFNCTPTKGKTVQKLHKATNVWSLASSKEAGLCSEERSMISPDYARNWICDFILGKSQPNVCKTLFD